MKRALWLILVLLVLSDTPVLAHHRHRHWASQEWSLAPQAGLWIYHSLLPCNSRDDCDRKDYDESGTRGRMGLGASPYHPEGPGNATD